MGCFTIATWNVNSLKVRLPQVLEYLENYSIDALCLQELKLQDSDVPRAEFEEAGFDIYCNAQKTYNGVATIIRKGSCDGFIDIQNNNPLYEDPQKRLITGTLVKGNTQIRLVNGYFPNGESLESDKYSYKIAWLNKLNEYIHQELQERSNLILVGDFNIVPEDCDCHDPEDWRDSVLCSSSVREVFFSLKKLGLFDAFRQFPQPDKSYSWWDYRMLAFRRNRGLRIDHILISKNLIDKNRSTQIDKKIRANERPSDHAPVRIELDL
ncbi:MAG: exodeoxyribonuclease III [Burkholderiaceae bacterium]|nr:exodeoxyribonuclease III [Burkholderiaceae bacterium]